MDKNTKTTATKPADFPKTEAPQAVRETAGAPQAVQMVEKSATQAKETYEKMNAATTEAADLIKNSYSTAVKGVQDYNMKFVEFAHANTNAAFDFVQKLSGVKSPSAFIELSTEHARKQLETLTEQTTQLLALAQKATLATAEPLKTGAAKAFNHAA
jgi:phasin